LITTRFRPGGKLIIIHPWIWGQLGDRISRMALDPAATLTLVVPELLYSLGYSPRDGERITEVTTVINVQRGFDLRVQRFRDLGFEFTDFLVHVQDLHRKAGIEGLLGLNFLNHFNYEVRSRDGLIHVWKARRARKQR
jgi:hypothetical protein